MASYQVVLPSFDDLSVQTKSMLGALTGFTREWTESGLLTLGRSNLQLPSQMKWQNLASGMYRSSRTCLEIKNSFSGKRNMCTSSQPFPAGLVEGSEADD